MKPPILSTRPMTCWLALALMAGCATSTPSPALAPGRQATVEGRVLAVDTAPWAYDGNAVVTLLSATQGTVAVHLPARWNLCKAPPPDDPQALKPGQRIRAVGTVDSEGAVVVCERSEHRLSRLD